MTTRAFLTAMIAGCVLGFSGCARWSPLEENPQPVSSSLWQHVPSADVAQVEVMLMRLGPEQSEELLAIWPRVNEQAIPIELRRRLDRNGIRAGVIGSVIPIPLQTMIDGIEKRLNDDPLEQVGIGADVRSHSRLLQCRAGQRKEVVLRTSKGGNVNLFHNEDGIAKGRTYEEPQFLFDLRAFPKGDGTTSVTLCPELLHGPFKQKFVSQEYALRREMKRDSEIWPDLKIDQVLAAGEVLLMTASLPPRGLGEQLFFTETAAGAREQMLMLVRVGPSRLDSAFDSKGR